MASTLWANKSRKHYHRQTIDHRPAPPLCLTSCMASWRTTWSLGTTSETALSSPSSWTPCSSWSPSSCSCSAPSWSPCACSWRVPVSALNALNFRSSREDDAVNCYMYIPRWPSLHAKPQSVPRSKIAAGKEEPTSVRAIIALRSRMLHGPSTFDLIWFCWFRHFDVGMQQDMDNGNGSDTSIDSVWGLRSSCSYLFCVVVITMGTVSVNFVFVSEFEFGAFMFKGICLHRLYKNN